jgi:hypothetical protein
MNEEFTAELASNPADELSENSTALGVEAEGGGDTDDCKGVDAADRG